MSDVKKKILDIDTGKSQKSLGDLKKEIKDLRSQLLSLDKGTKEYRETAQRLGNAMHELVEVQESAKYATADLGQTISSVSSLAGAASSSIAAMTGTLSLFGIDAGKSAAEVTKLITTFMSIGQAASSIDTASKAYKGLNARLISYIAAKKAESVAQKSSTAATVAETTAKGAEAVATKGAEVAQRGFNAAIKANPLGALLTVITAVIGGIVALTKALKSIGDAKAEKQIAKVNNEMKNFNREMQSAIANNDFFADMAEAAGKSAKEVRQIRFDNANDELKTVQSQMDAMWRKLQDEKNGKNRKRVVANLQEQYDNLVAMEQSAYAKLDGIRKQNAIAEQREITQAAEKRKEEAKKAYEERKKRLEDEKKLQEQSAKDLKTSQENLQKSEEELNKSRLEGASAIQYQINLYSSLLEKLKEEQSALTEGTTEWNNYQTKINNTTQALEKEFEALDKVNKETIKNSLDTQIDKEENSYTKQGYDIDNTEYEMESQRLEAEYQLEVEHVNRLKELYKEYRDNEFISKEEYDARIIDLEQDLASREIEIAKQKKEEKIALEQATYSAIESISGSLTGVLSSIADNYEQGTKEYKGLKIAETIISTATAIMKTWEGYASLGIPGTIAAGVQTAALATTGALQIAKIKKVKTDGSENGSSGAEARYSINPSVISNMQSDYTQHQLQQISDNTQNQQDTRVYVVASDIEEALSNKRTIVSNNTF